MSSLLCLSVHNSSSINVSTQVNKFLLALRTEFGSHFHRTLTLRGRALADVRGRLGD